MNAQQDAEYWQLTSIQTAHFHARIAQHHADKARHMTNQIRTNLHISQYGTRMVYALCTMAIILTIASIATGGM